MSTPVDMTCVYLVNLERFGAGLFWVSDNSTTRPFDHFGSRHTIIIISLFHSGMITYSMRIMIITYELKNISLVKGE